MRKKLLTIILFSLSLIAFSGTPQQKSYNGQEILQFIKDNYNKEIKSCDGGSPGIKCSGILLGIYNKGEEFWNSKPWWDHISFSYLRKDTKVSRLPYDYGNGYIVTNYDANKLNKLAFSCAFPVQGYSGDRYNKGCGEHKDWPRVSKPCNSQGVETDFDWLKQYIDDQHLNYSKPEIEERRCGFELDNNKSVNNFEAFTSLYNLLNSSVEGNNINEHNEIVVDKNSWDEYNPEELPITALFYLENAHNNGVDEEKALAQALEDQETYKRETGITLPIIKIRLPVDQNGETKFTLYGDDNNNHQNVFEEIKKKYSLEDLPMCEDGSVGLFCSGLLLGINNEGENFWDKKPWWDHISFAYLRKDVALANLAYEQVNGYIISKQDNNNFDKLDFLCAFPVQAYSGDRDNYGCGEYEDYPVESQECNLQDIYTSFEWAAKYVSDYEQVQNPTITERKSCSFNLKNDRKISNFEAFSDAEKRLGFITSQQGIYKTGHNEIIVKGSSWNINDNPKDLPIVAIFYLNHSVDNVPDDEILERALKDHQAYKEATGIDLPIIKIDLPEDYDHEAKFELYN